MKSKLFSLLACGLLCAVALPASSCSAMSPASKASAANLGGGLALDSLNLAARVLEGEGLNWKIEAAKLGLNLARQATTVIVANLVAPAPSAATVVTNSEQVAKEVIQAALVESPKVTALAGDIASQAADAARVSIHGPAP